jgi:ATP-dependent DNA helicase HFM1/MER3
MKEGKYRAQFSSMFQDKTAAFQPALRIAKCMRDCVLQRKDALSLVSIMTLERCLHARCWNDTGTPLKQIRGIGASSVRLLALKGIKTFEQLRNVEPESLEVWFNRSSPFGRDIINDLERVPRYDLKIFMESKVGFQIFLTNCFRPQLDLRR